MLKFQPMRALEFITDHVIYNPTCPENPPIISYGRDIFCLVRQVGSVVIFIGQLAATLHVT